MDWVNQASDRFTERRCNVDVRVLLGVTIVSLINRIYEKVKVGTRKS